MPLPMGHAVLGLTSQYMVSQDTSVFKKWKPAMVVMMLANLPDIDVLIGLVFFSNGNAIHRGPTHSLLFALVAGLFFSKALRWIPEMPRISFRDCSLVILSHLAADHFFTSSPISFFFPFENLTTIGYSGWGDVVSTVIYNNINDSNIIFGCIIIISLNIFAGYACRALRGQAERAKGLASAPMNSASQSQTSQDE